MSKIASVLKEEISRLARKEINARTVALRKASTQYRRDIAQLKRHAGELEKKVAYLERLEKKRAERGAPLAKIEGRRFSARGLKTHRKAVGLSAADYGRLVGVTAQTVYNWERGKAKPRDQQLASLLAVKDLGKREAHRRLELLDT
jgi:DNA-binding transcriptional regulator YiaG